MVGIESTLIILVIAASAVAMIARQLHVPYTVALVLAGVGLGYADHLVPGFDAQSVRLTPELLFSLFLPILLFEAAFHLSFTKFKSNIRVILLLAAPGVAVAIGIAGALTYLLEPLSDAALPVGAAFLFASMVAATDPVSVIALFKEIGVPKRLAVLMEGESLLNDGVAVVFFVALGSIMGLQSTAEPVTALWLVKFLVWEIAGGIGIGIVVGLLTSYLTTLIDDHLIEITLTTIAAFGSYLLAHRLHASGVLAVVSAGMLCGNVGARYGMTPSNKIAVESFWDYAVFAANSFVFLLIGKELNLESLVRNWFSILIAWAVLLVARASVIAAVSKLMDRSPERLPKRWPLILTWGGLRGGLSMVLALSLPLTFPERSLLLDLTFGVVLVSILVQGLTIAPLVRWSGAVRSGIQTDYIKIRVALKATREALRSLDRSLANAEIHQATFDILREKLGGREVALEESLDSMEPQDAQIKDELRLAEERLFEVEREAVKDATRTGLIDDQAAKSLLRDIDDRLVERRILAEHAKSASPASDT